MKSLFDTAAADEVCSRIDRLTAQSQRQWGKMDVAQMLAHCAAAMEMACGDHNPKQMFIGRLIGGRLKHHLTNDVPMKRNAPTGGTLKIQEPRDIERERARLKELVRRFSQGGEAKCTRHPHMFFGRLEPQEWAMGMYKHIDHHLQQFGV